MKHQENKNPTYYYVPMEIVFKYAEECPISYSKCDSFQEVKDKINRMVALGRRLFIPSETVFEYYQYHNKVVTIIEDRVFGIRSDKYNYHPISEQAKENYMAKIQKIML